MFGSRFCFLYAQETLPAKYRDKFYDVAAMARETSRAWAIKEALCVDAPNLIKDLKI